MSDNDSPFEDDEDDDEEVELPPGYRSRSQRAMGQVTTTPPRLTSTPKFTATQQPRSGAADPNGANGGANAPNGAAGTLPPGNGNPCPPCPRCPTDAPTRPDPGAFPIGLVLGLGLVGGAIWWSGKMLSAVGDAEEELDLDALPSSVPRMLAASTSDTIEGEIVEEE